MNTFRAGSIGLVGLPNAGKSTLANAVVGEKVSIVSSKAQTTRQRVMGIYSSEQAQLVFVDAPGMIRSESGLNHFLQEEADDVFQQVDALLVVLALDTAREEQVDELLAFAKESGKPWACIITKTDLPCVHRIPKIESKVKAYGVPCWALSVERNIRESQNLLRKELASLLPLSEGPLYDPEQYTTQTIREMSAELIREQCFKILREEIPYGMAVRIVAFKEKDVKMPMIYAELIVSKENHKRIVVGTGGKVLKKIGATARQSIESLLQTQVFLDLHVSVKPKWAQNKKIMKELGYVLPN